MKDFFVSLFVDIVYFHDAGFEYVCVGWRIAGVHEYLAFGHMFEPRIFNEFFQDNCGFLSRDTHIFIIRAYRVYCSSCKILHSSVATIIARALPVISLQVFADNSRMRVCQT